MDRLRSAPLSAQASPRGRRQKTVATAAAPEHARSPQRDSEILSGHPTKVGGAESSSPASPWAALSMPHRPDVALLRTAQEEPCLTARTAEAVLTAERAALQPLATRVEQLRDRLLQPKPSWLDYSHWTAAMGKLYDSPEKGVVSRQIKPKVALQWRAEPLNSPIPGPKSKRVARELQEIMTEEAARRSSLIGDPNTEPHVRKRLLEEEERLSQAYRYLATYIK